MVWGRKDKGDAVSAGHEAAAEDDTRKEAFERVWGTDPVEGESAGNPRHYLLLPTKLQVQPCLAVTLREGTCHILPYSSLMSAEISGDGRAMTLAFTHSATIVSCSGEHLGLCREALQQQAMVHLFPYIPDYHHPIEQGKPVIREIVLLQPEVK